MIHKQIAKSLLGLQPKVEQNMKTNKEIKN